MRHRRYIHTSLAVAAVLAATAGTTNGATGWSLSSSIADGSTLSRPAQWSATPSGDVPGGLDRVEFLVDGKVLWTEHKPPYFFNDDYDYFYPWFFGRGPHTLAVRGVSTTGEESTATASVTVVSSTPKLPKALRGLLKRRMTQADVDRNSTPERPVELPPGNYTLNSPRNGVIRAAGALGVTWNAVTRVTKSTFTTGMPVAWLAPAAERGSVCSPEHTFATYRWKVTRRGIVFKAIKDPCANRRAVVEGLWKRG